MAPPIYTVSTARQKLFALFQAVTGRRGHKIVISNRGNEQHAVLLGEAYLNELEAAARRLLDIESGKSKPGSDFELVGSLRIVGDAEPLTDIREDANARWEGKLARLGSTEGKAPRARPRLLTHSPR